MPTYSAIADVSKVDEHNSKQILKFFNAECQILDDIANCYHLCGKLLGSSAATQAEALARSFIFGLCRNHLILGGISLIRCHSAMMFRETRIAIETAGTAHAIQTNSEMLEIFLDNDQNLKQRDNKKKVKNAFRPQNLFPHNIPLLKALDDLYRQASSRGHMNMVSFVLHLARNRDKETTEVLTQDMHEDRARHELPLELIWLCMAHIAILDTCDIIFPGIVSTPQMKPFVDERLYLKGKVLRFRQKHKSQEQADRQ